MFTLATSTSKAPRPPAGPASCGRHADAERVLAVGDERVALSETTGARRTWFGEGSSRPLVSRERCSRCPPPRLPCTREDERERRLGDEHRAPTRRRRPRARPATVTSTFGMFLKDLTTTSSSSVATTTSVGRSPQPSRTSSACASTVRRRPMRRAARSCPPPRGRERAAARRPPGLAVDLDLEAPHHGWERGAAAGPVRRAAREGARGRCPSAATASSGRRRRARGSSPRASRAGGVQLRPDRLVDECGRPRRRRTPRARPPSPSRRARAPSVTSPVPCLCPEDLHDPVRRAGDRAPGRGGGSARRRPRARRAPAA